MLFNSFEFIFLFLPLAIIGYFLINRFNNRIAKVWLIGASLFFYSWWNIKYLPLILVSIGFNFTIGRTLSSDNLKFNRKNLLIIGLIGNIGLLGYYKYADFFINNVNSVFSTNLALLNLALPLAISFFTFQQIAFLVDTYRGEAKEYDLLNYALFVSFFPQLIAGPIVHHREMMPQFNSKDNYGINYRNLSKGLFIFIIGLFKKIVLADTFAVWATYGFDTAPSLTMIEAWIVSLSYTFQLYFDFSGYTDMAIGAALMFNIKLPINFFSPYKSLDIQDFWRRWHMTLGRFLRNYIYIPLGGNRRGDFFTYRNLMITFLIGGLWHGAGWNFVFWGFLHGLALVIHRIWRKLGFKMNKILAWFITFNFVNVAWVFFRAKTWSDALKVLKGMVGMNGIVLPASWADKLTNLTHIEFGNYVVPDLKNALLMLIIGFIISVFFKNSIELRDNFKPNFIYLAMAVIMALAALSQITSVSEFLYFNF
ncbi:MAG: MBOAT family protein [Syntrophomonadaceae bacterium]|nr:MBOAT family protein [Syntrophomonadaceae bacterium]